MATEYSKGRYNVYKYGPVGSLLGFIDHDEFVRSLKMEKLYRLDNDEVYRILPGGTEELAGYLEDGIATDLNDKFLFIIHED